MQGLLIALIAHRKVKDSEELTTPMWAMIVGGIVGMIVMAGGYYVAGGVLYGFKASLVEIPLNLMQSGVGVVLGIAVSKSVTKAYPPVRNLYW
jgi:uncharacterized membrane protein